MVALDRVTLKKKVVDAPEILTVIGQMPHLAQVRLLRCQLTRASGSLKRPRVAHRLILEATDALVTRMHGTVAWILACWNRAWFISCLV